MKNVSNEIQSVLINGAMFSENSKKVKRKIKFTANV